MGLHCVGIGGGHGERRADACRADCPEQIGALVALIGRLARPGSAPGLLLDQAVLLADAGFVLEPEFDRLALRQMGEMGLQVTAMHASCAGWCGRTLLWKKPTCFRSFPIVRS